MAVMNNAILVVRSVTSAIKGQKILEANGISAYVERNTAPSSRQGCGYVLRIQGDVTRAASLLHSAGVQVTEILGR